MIKKPVSLLWSVVSCQLPARRSFSVVGLVVLILFLVSSLLFIVAPHPVHAAPSPTPGPADCEVPDHGTPQQTIDAFNKCAIKKNVFDDKVFNLNQISGTSDSLYTMLIGKSLLHPETDAVTEGNGAVAQVGRVAMSFYAAPPASGVQYFASQIHKLNPVQPAYAQGIGFTALSPVQDLWERFRNAAYLAFVVIFVIMGFMIMFRAHISPQAVATVQDSLPRIVVALILVTFSYAIAGLMIDLMFLFLNVIINLLGLTVEDANKVIFEKNILQIGIGAWDDVVGKVAGVLKQIIDDVINFDFPIIGDIISGSLAFIGGLVAAIAMLFVMFRVFFMLLMSYVMILILTLVAPFFFLLQALPGNNGAKEWFKQMGANVSVFVVVGVMILFAGILTGIGAFGGTCAPGATGCTGTLSDEKVLKFPLLAGGFTADTIGKLIGFGILFMTPEAAKMVKEAIGAKGLGGGAGLGAGAAALGAAAAPFAAAARAGGKAAYERSPIGGAFRTGEAMRGERAGLQARQNIHRKLAGKDLLQYGVGYPKEEPEP